MMIFEDNTLRAIVIRTSGNGFQNYCYLLYEKQSKEGVLIDPSWEADIINSILYDHKVALRHVLLTHSHFDHINLSDYYTRINGVPAWLSDKEISHYSPSLKNLEPFESGHRIALGDHCITAITTPGHTKGSACFLANHFLFTGDTLFPEGCGICTCEGGNPNDMFSSIQLLKSCLSDSVKIFQGHNYGIAPGMSFQLIKKQNIYMQIEHEDTFVKFRMRSNQKDYMEFK